MWAARVAVVTAAGALAMSSGSAAEAAPKTFKTGFIDQATFESPSRDLWLDRVRSVGGSRIRIAFGWSTIAPTAPPADQAGSAAWSGYRFEIIDAQVRAAVAKGLVPLLSPSGSPAWASASDRPKSESFGSWKPDAAAFGQFMRALAERYSGGFADPTAPGKTLPRVAQFQVWNEPNLASFLAPQYEKGKPFAARRFRELVNAGYAGVKDVQPGATVVAGGLAPYGDPGTKTTRTRPLLFLRQMLCLNSALKADCREKTNVDALSIHPYTRNKPSQGAFNKNDITVPDLPRMQKAIAAARSARTLGPSRTALWVTEIHWETSPDPEGISSKTRARYISEAFWRLWRANVPVAYWYLLRDEPYTAGEKFFASYQSGLFLRSGRQKSDARAFQFPLTVTGTGRRDLNVWFRTPTKGTATVQVRRKGRWTSVEKIRGLALDGVSQVTVRRAGVTAVRAKAGKATSYVWTIR